STLIVAALTIPPWIRATVPEQQVRRVLQALLVASQPAYGAVFALLTATMVVLGRMVIRARRQGESRPRAARVLLLCASGLFTLVMAEGAAAAWLAWTHRYP